jgi:hypothetical protein
MKNFQHNMNKNWILLILLCIIHLKNLEGEAFSDLNLLKNQFKRKNQQNRNYSRIKTNRVLKTMLSHLSKPISDIDPRKTFKVYTGNTFESHITEYALFKSDDWSFLCKRGRKSDSILKILRGDTNEWHS